MSIVAASSSADTFSRAIPSFRSMVGTRYPAPNVNTNMEAISTTTDSSPVTHRMKYRFPRMERFAVMTTAHTIVTGALMRINSARENGIHPVRCAFSARKTEDT